MGMIGYLIRVSNEDLKSFKADSSKLEKLIDNNESLHANWYLDLDKSWEAIHFLLTGKSMAETEMNEEPRKIVENVIFSNDFIDEEQDLGYGPAFYNDSVLVKKISFELNNLNVEELESKYDGNKLNEANIYPEIWNEEEAKPYLFDSLKDVIRFYSEAAHNDQVVIGFIS
ncbi:YfbM family protein [Catalinimonas sp. 4WD22]|uniref:YfbM family protein n=1 Tax=Catalinimonas locisalis TaxID=3133978 RepID=UPI003100DF4A